MASMRSLARALVLHDNGCGLRNRALPQYCIRMVVACGIGPCPSIAGCIGLGACAMQCSCHSEDSVIDG